MLKFRRKAALIAGAIGAVTTCAAFIPSSIAAPTTEAASITTLFAPNPNVGWIAARGQFSPPLSGPGPLVRDTTISGATNDEFRATGRQPTFPIPDLSNPILQPWVKEALRNRTERIRAGKSAFSPQSSCRPAGVPAFLLHAVFPIFFVQGSKEVLIIWQGDAEVRHIYLTDKHTDRVHPSWTGESIGHYEGDTLVVDTIGIDARTFVDNYQTPHSDKLHVIERFHVIDQGMTVEVNLHVDDPGAFTTPWNAIQRYRRVEPGVAENTASDGADPGPLLEMSCAENPHNDLDADALPIPFADKPDF